MTGMAFEANGRRMCRGFLNTMQFGFACGPFLDFAIGTRMKFNDGRAFSYARLLRERYGFQGEVRAVGEVLRDLLLYMHRCGFDAFEIDRQDAVERWQAALAEVSVWYQPTADGRSFTLRQRARGGGAMPKSVEERREACR